MRTRSLCVPVSLLLFVGSCLCQIPRPCANSEGLRTKECCPVWEGDGSACGIESGRGNCTEVRVTFAPHGDQYPYHGKDDREKWPLEFFNRTCHCFGNYSGFDCGDCMFGHWGDDCSQYRGSVRLNVLTLSDADKKTLVDYFDQAQHTVNPDYVIATATRDDMGPNGESPKFANVTTLELFAWMHYFVCHPTFLPDGSVFKDINFAHEASAFTVWHRIYLLHFENEIRKMTQDFNFTLPYWDWRDKTECDVCTDDLMGAQDPNNPNLISPGSPFSKWKIICSLPDEYTEHKELCNGTKEGPLTRNPGNNDKYSTLPTTAQVELMMGFLIYEDRPYDRTAEQSFRNMLEGFANATGHTVPSGGRTEMHNSIHVYLNGSMSFLESAANDPIFYLHHAFVDSLFERWLRRVPTTDNQYPRIFAPIGHNYDYHMVPFLPTYLNGVTFKSTDLGYEYDYLLHLLNRGPDLNVPVWSEWSEWSDCVLPGLDSTVIIPLNRRCKPILGTHSRYRQCIRHGHDGAACVGEPTKTRPCYNIEECHFKGTWTDIWSNWSKCRPACGSNDSKKFRERISQPDYSQYSENIHFHGRPVINSGELPEGQTKTETQVCPFHACRTGRRFE